MAVLGRLEGGPEDLRDQIVPIVPPGDEIKMPYRGGYEHYKVTTRHEDTEKGRVTVFSWWERTEIAE
ncbi:DUF5988 family protein [Streptomyces sp. GC420]|uniref:DUF5988 family protein n=1 Tax=Streptomyces sp. GC420 TaxID=2697568 RepID=UPI001414D657|nr:DUF5988 family protein [Streptomyces sp. GC420]NBM16698.1 hypothetical protein [Streptomyces sp. GC420]